jgi:hypothetical protein
MTRSRPGQSHRGEPVEIDLGVDRRRIETAVPQDIGDILHRCAGAKKPACDAVPEDVNP